MPTLLIWRDHRFRFYPSDGPEPPHVHVVKDGRAAKVWLRSLEVEYSHGYNDREIKELVAVIAENQDGWIGSWNDFFGL